MSDKTAETSSRTERMAAQPEKGTLAEYRAGGLVALPAAPGDKRVPGEAATASAITASKKARSTPADSVDKQRADYPYPSKHASQEMASGQRQATPEAAGTGQGGEGVEDPDPDVFSQVDDECNKGKQVARNLSSCGPSAA